MKRQTAKICSILLAVLMTFSCILLFPDSVFAEEGNEAKIGDTKYATLVAAIDAAQDGDTVTLLRNVTWTAYNKEIKKTITIDGGEQKYKITATQGYTFQFFQSFTLKNLKFDTISGFRFWNTAGKEAVGTLENVEWTLGAGLLVNLQGNTPGVPLTFNVINSTITKTAVAGDPIIATYSHNSWAKPGICDVTVNIDNSTLNQNGGATNGHTGNTAMFYFCCAKTATLNLKNRAVLNYNPLGKAGTVQSLIVYEIPTAVNLEADVQLNLSGSSAVTERNTFAYRGHDGGSLTVTDHGAIWSAAKAIAANGLLIPAFDSYNGESLANWSLRDGDKTVTVSTSPFKYEALGETVTFLFSTYVFRQEDFAMNAGAAIRTEAPNAMAISGSIAKSLYNNIAQVGENVVYELFLVKKTDLNATKLGGEEYNLNLLGGRDKKQVNRIYWSESEDGKSMLFRGCIYGLDADTEYVMVAVVTFLLGEDELLYHSMIVEADHTRTVRGIAAEALKDAEYSDNAYLKSLVSGTN